MVLGAAHDDGLAIEIAEDAAKITVQFFAEGFVAQERLAVFGREDRMHQNLCERLRNGGMMGLPSVRSNPFRVDVFCLSQSQGSSFLATLG